MATVSAISEQTTTITHSSSSSNTLKIPHHHTPTTTTTFPHFRDLPTELRLQIYEHALEAPRVIDARFAHIRDGRTPHWSDAAGRRLEHAHALFFACRESRDAVVRWYPRYVVLAVEGRLPVRHRLRLALAGRDVLAVPGDAALGACSDLRVWGVDSGSCGGEGEGEGGGGGEEGDREGEGGGGGGGGGRIRQVLVQVNADALFDVVGSGPWYPSGWPHTKVMERAVARETFERLCSVFGGRGAGGDDLQTVYCLEEGWTSTPRGLKRLHSLPSTAGSVWDYHPISTCMVKLYDKAIDGVREDDEKGGSGEGVES